MVVRCGTGFKHTFIFAAASLTGSGFTSFGFKVAVGPFTARTYANGTVSASSTLMDVYLMVTSPLVFEETTVAS